MGIVNRDGALYMATGFDNTGMYAERREAIGIIKAMMGQITSLDVFAGIGISAATAFASAAKDSYNFEKEFRKNMLEVATISTQVSGSMTDFMNQVMEITQQIPIKAPDAAKALYQIVSAGHDGAAGMNILKVAAKSAVGGITDTVTAADAITTLLNAYKLSADDAEKVSDQLFTTARLGKTTFGELGQSIAQVAPIAASYGVEMDQVLAAVATLTKSGTPTAQAMTQIRASIIGTSKVLGDGAFDSMTFQEALAEIANRAGGSEAKLRELILEMEAVNGVLGMTGIKAQDAASDLDAMNKSAGATETAFKKMQEDVDNQMILISNNIQAALRPMGGAILKNVSEAAQMINKGFETGQIQYSMEVLQKLLIAVAGAFVTYKSAAIGASAAEVYHSAKTTISNNLKSLQSQITGEAIITKEKERVHLDAYTASLEKSITEEQRAKLAKLDLKVGSEEYVRALSEQALQEKKNADNQVESLTKLVSRNKEKLSSAQENLEMSHQAVEAAKAELNAAIEANDLIGLEIAQTKMNAAAQREEAASTNVATASKGVKTSETRLATATTAAETATTRVNTATTAADTAVTNISTTAKNRLKVATLALWGAMKANPIGAILTLVSLATTAYMMWSVKINDVSDKMKRFNTTSKSSMEDTQKSIDENSSSLERLITKYNELNKISNPTREEQESLRDVVKAISEIVPSAITAIDQYNNALDINTNRATEYIKKQKEILAELSGKNVTEWTKELYNDSKKIAIAKQELSKGLKYSNVWGFDKGEILSPSEKIVTEKELSDIKIKRDLIFDLLSKTGIAENELRGELSTLFDVKSLFNTGLELDGRDELLKDFDVFYSKRNFIIEQKEKEKLLESNNNDGNKKELPSITKEVENAIKKVSDLKQSISDLRSGKTSAESGKTVQSAIEDKVKELKAAEDALSTLTGKSTKETDTLLKTQTELSRSILDNELKLQASRIAIMEEGKDKRIEECKETLAAIQKEKDEYIKLSKEAGKEPDKQVIAGFDERSLMAQEQLKKDVITINEEAAKEIKSIWDEVNSKFSTDLENQLAGIDKFYDEAIKKAEKAGAKVSEIAKLNAARNKEKDNLINDNFIDSEMQKLDIAEDVEIRLQDVRSTGYVSDSINQKKQNDIHKKYCQERLNTLKKSTAQEGTERFKQIQIERSNLEDQKKYLDEYGKLLISSIAQDAVKGLIEIGQSLKDVNSELALAADLSASILDSITDLSKGDYVGAALGVLNLATSVISSIAKSNQETIAISKKAEGYYWDAINNKIERQIELMKELNGVGADEANKSLDNKIKELVDTLHGADIDVALNKGSGIKGFLDLLEKGIASATKKGDEATAKFLKKLHDGWGKNKDIADLNGRYNATFFDVLKDMTKEELIALREIPEIWQILPAETQEYINQLNDAINKQKELNKETEELATGSSKNNIGDSIIQGFKEGKRSAADFADMFKDLMKNSVLQSLSVINDEKVKEWYKQYAEFAKSDGKLDENEIAELQKSWNNLIEYSENELSQLEKAIGIKFDAKEEEGVSGQLNAAMTEGTASQLVGLWNSTAIDMRELKNLTADQRDSVRSIVTYVTEILKQNYLIEQHTRRGADNTDGLIDELRIGFSDVSKRLGSIEKNTKTSNSRG